MKHSLGLIGYASVLTNTAFFGTMANIFVRTMTAGRVGRCGLDRQRASATHRSDCTLVLEKQLIGNGVDAVRGASLMAITSCGALLRRQSGLANHLAQFAVLR